MEESAFRKQRKGLNGDTKRSVDLLTVRQMYYQILYLVVHQAAEWARTQDGTRGIRRAASRSGPSSVVGNTEEELP